MLLSTYTYHKSHLQYEKSISWGCESIHIWEKSSCVFSSISACQVNFCTFYKSITTISTVCMKIFRTFSLIFVVFRRFLTQLSNRTCVFSKYYITLQTNAFIAIATNALLLVTNASKTRSNFSHTLISMLIHS